MQASTDSYIWTATGHEPQVFLDPSGRRARALRTLAAILSAVVLSAPLALVAGATGFSALPPVKLGSVAPQRAPSPPPATILRSRRSTTHSLPPVSAPARAVASQPAVPLRRARAAQPRRSAA